MKAHDIDPLALEAAKRAILTEEFARFRERAVQKNPVLVQSQEYQPLRRILADEDHLTTLAAELVANDPNIALVAKKAPNVVEAAWILIRGLHVADRLSALRDEVTLALSKLDPDLARDYRRNDSKVYKALREAFAPKDDETKSE